MKRKCPSTKHVQNDNLPDSGLVGPSLEYQPFPWPVDKNAQTLSSNPIGGDFPGGAVVKNPPANAGDMGSIPGPGRSHMRWRN